MTENPYEVPKTNSDRGTELPGVVVHSRIPLHLTAECRFQIDARRTPLADRIQRAAEVCSLAIVERDDDRVTLRRGSNWHALYTFDIRKLPTVVTISIQPPDQIHVMFRCYSVLQFSTRGDARRMLRELTRFRHECQADG